MKLSTLCAFGLGMFPFLLVPSAALAHPGNTDSAGGHTCRTNCANWGLSTGEYHYHNSKGPAQSSYPIRSTYGANGTGYTQPWPAYAESSYYSAPSCPANSYSNGASCTCNYGYVVKGSSCVSAALACTSQLGLMSRYNSLSSSCECMTGYEIGASGLCTYKSPYSSYSSPSSYYGSSALSCPAHSSESLTNSDKCTCDSGYQVNKKKNTCEKIPSKNNDQICRDSFGSKSKWNGKLEDGSPVCICKAKYEWNDKADSCIKSRK
ncbi:MAG: hypothetical protein AB203_01470 [Parcubacteria bacterium C7867-008]|nr:MAG: hypothetical protein AB203_01470 [Parcubacteria bacterium C7867-008]